MRIQDKLLRGAFIEILIALNRLVQSHDGDVDGLGNFDFVMQDCHHQLPVVLQNRTLSGGKYVGFCPAQTNPDPEASCLGVFIFRAGIVGDVESPGMPSAPPARQIVMSEFSTVAGISVPAS